MLKIDEAIDCAKKRGIKIKKKELAAKLWPDSTESAQQVSMTKLCAGRKKLINPDWVVIICRECGVTPNFLFGYE